MLHTKAEVENKDIAKSGAKKCGVSLSCPSVANAKSTIKDMYETIPSACKKAIFEDESGFFNVME